MSVTVSQGLRFPTALSQWAAERDITLSPYRARRILKFHHELIEEWLEWLDGKHRGTTRVTLCWESEATVGDMLRRLIAE